MDNVKQNIEKNIEKNKENPKTSVFPTVEQIIKDLQIQLSNTNPANNKILNTNGMFLFIWNFYIII